MFLVDSEENLAKALKLIADNEILAYDTETTGLNVRKDLVIGFGVSTVSEGFYVPIHIYDSRSKELGTTLASYEIADKILKQLQSKKLLMFNASFDARITLNHLWVDLLPALIADVLLLKHTCDEDFPLDLKGIAAKVFGADVKKEKEEMLASIRANGGTATEYYKADLNTMAKYCVQDCILTYRLFEHYSKDLKKQGLEQFYYEDEVLPLYKNVTIPMESIGVRLDIPKIEQAIKDIKKDMLQIESSIQSQIAPHLSLFTSWFLNKDYPYKETGKIGKLMKKRGLTLEQAQMEAWNDDSDGAFMFNLLSKHHLKKLFFDTLNEEPLTKTDLGNPQVNEDFLDAMGKKYPWAQELITYNKLTKLKSTYMVRLLEESENGRFYPSFQQHRTVSGRYSGDMQQLPRPIESSEPGDIVAKYTNQIREFILADEGSSLCSADYEQLEPSVFAHTSGDPALHNIFNNGLDFYSEVAIRTEHLQGVSSVKSAPNYLGALDKTARQKAKAYALGIAYGMTGYKLQFEIGVPKEDAERLVQDYLNSFPKLAEWMHKSQDEVRFSGQVRTQLGRVRHMPQARRLFTQYGARLSDSLQLWKDFHHNPVVYAQAKADRKTYINYMNNAINFQVQGLAASIVNRASIKLAKEFLSRGLKTRIVGQIHDELLFNVPLNEKETVSPLIQEVMQGIVKLAVPLRTVPQFGQNFRECK